MPESVECPPPKSEPSSMGSVQMTEESSSDLKREAQRYLREIKDIPDPNFGRIRELRDKIRAKTLLTREAIWETVERLAARFLGRE
jgi:hypothetical protein